MPPISSLSEGTPRPHHGTEPEQPEPALSSSARGEAAAADHGGGSGVLRRPRTPPSLPPAHMRQHVMTRLASRVAQQRAVARVVGPLVHNPPPALPSRDYDDRTVGVHPRKLGEPEAESEAEPADPEAGDVVSEFPKGSTTLPSSAGATAHTVSFTTMLKAKIKFREKPKAQRAAAQRRHWLRQLAIVLSILAAGILLVAFAMQRSGVKSVSQQLRHLATVNVQGAAAEIDHFLRQSSSAVEVVAGALKRGDIHPTSEATDHFLLSVLDIFGVSSVFIYTATDGAVYSAGGSDNGGVRWLGHSARGQCMRSWAAKPPIVDHGSRLHSRDLAAAANATACDFDASDQPWYGLTKAGGAPATLMSGDGVVTQWGAGRYLRSAHACTAHSCPTPGRRPALLHASQPLLYHPRNGSAWAVAGVECSVQLLNARLQRLRHSAFDGAREGFASVHVFVVAVGGRELIGSTDAVIAADLERGASATLDSHAALSEASRLLSKADFSSAFVHIAPDLDMNIPVLSCAPLAPRIVAGDAAAEQGWALCLQVPLDFYVSFTSSAWWLTAATLLLGASALGAHSCFLRRLLSRSKRGGLGSRGHQIQFVAIVICLVATFFSFERYTRSDITLMTEDLTIMITKVVQRKVTEVLLVPSTILSLLDTYRRLGLLTQGNTTLADAKQSDSLYVDLMQTFPEVGFIYSGASFPVASSLVACSAVCPCNHGNDPPDCCATWELSDTRRHCTGLADEQFVYFNGVKRLAPGPNASAFQVAAREQHGRLSAGAMLRRGYPAVSWQQQQFRRVHRNMSHNHEGSYYNPAARPWFNTAMQAPLRGWAPIYLFASIDPTTGRKPLGLTATRTHVNTVFGGSDSAAQSRLAPLAALSRNATVVDGVDFKLSTIDTFLATIEFSPGGSELAAQNGVVFMMELDGTVVGTSDGGSAVVVFYEGASEQRVRCQPTGCQTTGDGTPLVSPMIQLVYNELLHTYTSIARWRTTAGDDGQIAGIKVGHGHAGGPYLVNTASVVSGEGGIDWLVVVAFQERYLLEQYRQEYKTSVVIAQFVVAAVILGFVLASYMNTDDVADGRFTQVIQQCRRDLKSSRMILQRNSGAQTDIGQGTDNVSLVHGRLCTATSLDVSQDFEGFCDWMRAKMLVDTNINGLLCKIHAKEEAKMLPKDWDPTQWLDLLFTAIGEHCLGPAYIKYLLRQPREARETVTQPAVADLLLHIGFTGTVDPDRRRTDLRMLATFLRNSRATENKWTWQVILKSKMLCAERVAHIVSNTGLVTARLGTATDNQTCAFLSDQCDCAKIKNPEFWKEVDESVRERSSDLSSRRNRLLSVVKNPAKRECFGTFLDFVCTTTIFLNSVRDFTKFLQDAKTVTKTMSGHDDYWEWLMREESMGDSAEPEPEPQSDLKPEPHKQNPEPPEIRGVINALREHVHARAVPLWKEWVIGQPIDLLDALLSLEDGKKGLVAFTKCMQAIGYSGGCDDLKPLFQKCRERASTALRARASNALSALHRGRSAAQIENGVNNNRTRFDTVSNTVEVFRTRSRQKDDTRTSYGTLIRCNVDDWRRCREYLRVPDKCDCRVDDVLLWERSQDNYRLSLSRIVTSSAYQWIIFVGQMAHLSLVFLEAPAGATIFDEEKEEDLEARLRVNLTYGLCCLLVHWADISIMMYWRNGPVDRNHFIRQLSTLRPSGAAFDHPLLKGENDKRIQEGVPPKLQRHFIAYIGVVCVITADWVAQACIGTGYTTGPSQSSRLVLLLPFTSILRPCLIVLRFNDIRHGAIAFVKTLIRSKQVFVVFGCFLLVLSVFSVILSTRRSDNMFDGTSNAFISLFTYMTTAENWPDVVWPATACHPNETAHVSGQCWEWLLHMFWMSISISGSLVLMSLIIAKFESTFTEFQTARETKLRERRLQGICAAFCVLDSDFSGKLDADLIAKFFDACGIRNVYLGYTGTRPTDRSAGKAFGKQLDVADFAELCELVHDQLQTVNELNMHAASELGPDSEPEPESSVHKIDGDGQVTGAQFKKAYINSTAHHFVMLSLSTIHLITMAGYRSGLESESVDRAGWTFFVLFQLEIVARILPSWGSTHRKPGFEAFRSSWRDFWHVPQDFYTQSKNRYDFHVSCVALLALIVASGEKMFVSASSDSPEAMFWDSLHASHRITIAIHGLRVFSSIETIRVIWFCMLTILPKYSNVYVLLMLGFFSFACAGCWFLAGSFSKLEADVYDMPQANFNSMLDALTTLCQLFIGEAWNDVKDAAVNSSEAGFIELYFLSFILCMSVLFFNIIAGVILSAFEIVQTVVETEKTNMILSVREFHLLTSHRSLGNERLRTQFVDNHSMRVMLSNRALSTLFTDMDSDQDGFITQEDLYASIRALGGDEKEASELWSKIDIDGDGKVTRAEMEVGLKASSGARK